GAYFKMAWIVDSTSTQETLTEQFKEMIKQKEILQLPGAHDAIAALYAKKDDFNALYLSGGAYTASMGIPDLGMINSTEVAERAKELLRATKLPLLVDIETGFGGVLNIARPDAVIYQAKV